MQVSILVNRLSMFDWRKLIFLQTSNVKKQLGDDEQKACLKKTGAIAMTGLVVFFLLGLSS